MNVSPDYDKLKNSISTIHLYVGDIKSMNDIDMLDYSTALNYSKVSHSLFMSMHLSVSPHRLLDASDYGVIN